MSGQSQSPHVPAAAVIRDRTRSGYRFVIAGLAAVLGFSAGLNLFATGPITPLIIDDYEINHSA